jgi:probable phosphoglycerate mutase
MSVSLVVWRHGRTAWNTSGRFQGHADVELDEVGRTQALVAAESLAARDPAAIVSSDLARARATAEALAARTGVDVIIDPGLREAHVGRWEGLTHEQVRATDADLLARWRSDATVAAGGTGESAQQVGARMAEAAQRHAESCPDGRSLVFVTHGGAGRALVGRLMGWPADTWKRMTVLDNCAWADLELHPRSGWRLTAYNRGPA